MPNISEYPGSILTYFTGLIGILVGKIFQIFVWRTPKGRCYGNQLNMGDVRKRHVERPSLFASAFENRLADRKSAFKRFNSNNHPVKIWWTSSSNLRVYTVKTLNFCCDSPAIWRQSSFVALAFPNGLEDRNFDFSRVIGNHICTPCRNLVRFASMTPEFKT